MTNSWLYILVVMLAGSFIIHMYPTLVVAIGVNVGIFIASYFILRRDPRVDMRASMLFIFGLTVINILAALGWMSSMMANLAFIALFIWSMAGGGRSR